MPIQIPNQAIGSKPVENVGGPEQLNVVGSVDFQTYLLSTEKSDGQASIYSTLEFAKTHKTNFAEAYPQLDLQLDLDLLQFESELANSLAFQDQAIGISLWPAPAVEEATASTLVENSQNHGRQNALYFQLPSFAEKTAAIASVGSEAQGLSPGQPQKIDFVMTDPDTSLFPNPDNQGFVGAISDNPYDGIPILDDAAATQKTTVEVNFAVDSPLPVQSEYAGLSVDSNMTSGLYGYVGASTVQDNMMTKKLRRQQLLSQAAQAIKTRFRENGDKQTISLELNPAELGHLKILIERSGEKIQAKIIASEAVTKEFLTQDHGQLLQKLRDLNVGHAEIEIVHSQSLSNDENSQFDELDAEFAANSIIPVGINLVA